MTRAERRRRANEPPKSNVGMGGYGNKEREGTTMKQTTAVSMTDQQTRAAQSKADSPAFSPMYTKHFMIVFDPGDKRETIPPTYQVFRLTDLATATVGEPAPVYGWEDLADAMEFARRMDETVEWAVRQENLKAAIEATSIVPTIEGSYTINEDDDSNE
jgi:hypothetical protein